MWEGRCLCLSGRAEEQAGHSDGEKSPRVARGSRSQLHPRSGALARLLGEADRVRRRVCVTSPEYSLTAPQ